MVSLANSLVTRHRLDRPLLWREAGEDRPAHYLHDARAVFHRAPLSRDGIVEGDAHHARVNGELAFGHDLPRARDGHGNDRRSGLDRHDEDAPFERLKAAVGTAR